MAGGGGERGLGRSSRSARSERREGSRRPIPTLRRVENPRPRSRRAALVRDGVIPLGLSSQQTLERYSTLVETAAAGLRLGRDQPVKSFAGDRKVAGRRRDVDRHSVVAIVGAIRRLAVCAGARDRYLQTCVGPRRTRGRLNCHLARLVPVPNFLEPWTLDRFERQI